MKNNRQLYVMYESNYCVKTDNCFLYYMHQITIAMVV